MSKRKHPDAKLTLRQAFEKHYDQSELKLNSKKQFQYVLNRWEELTDNPPIGDIDNEAVKRFKQKLLDRGLAGRTVNGHRNTIRTILNLLGPQGRGYP